MASSTLRIALLLLALVLAAAACSPRDVAELDDDPGAGAAPLPEWITAVSPEPGAASAAIRQVEVRTAALEEGQQVRLTIDGTDVTTYALIDPTVVAYDPSTGGAPVELGPGEHTALAELVTLPEPGAQHTVLDQFEWSFSLQ